MDCNDTRSRLLEAVEGELADDETADFHAHISTCEQCRAEFAPLEEAHIALTSAIGRLAPRRVYLTTDRQEKLTRDHERGHKIFRLVSYRRFVAAAAVMAIVVSAAYITGQARLMLRPPEEGPLQPRTFAQQPPSQPYLPVWLASTCQDGPVQRARRMPVAAEAPRMRAPSRVTSRLLSTDSPGLIVPVNHAFYDPEESSHWW